MCSNQNDNLLVEIGKTALTFMNKDNNKIMKLKNGGFLLMCHYGKLYDELVGKKRDSNLYQIPLLFGSPTRHELIVFNISLKIVFCIFIRCLFYFMHM